MTLMDCIERIPVRLRETAERKFPTGEGQQRIDEIVIIASGSSYNAAFTAKIFLEKVCGLKVTLIYPNIFVNYHTYIQEKAMYLFISQGGKTRLVYEGLLLARQAGCLTYAMTAQQDCVIAEAADCYVDMGCGEEEYLYRTIGFSVTAASVMLLGASLAVANGKLETEEYVNLQADLCAAADNLENIKNNTLEWYERNRFSLLRRNTMLISAAGGLWPVAQESDIKAMEMVPMMTKSYELEEFIHGPQNAFHDGMIFILYSQEGEDEDKVRKIASFLKNEIGFCAVVGAAADENDKKDLKLIAKSRYFAPLEFITFMQVTAYKMAEARGRDLSRGVNSIVSKYIQKTIERKEK